MSDYRSAAEKFVTEFLDFVQQHDIQDLFNNKTQKMERSPGIDALIKSAESVFPPRVLDGNVENGKLKPEQVEQLVAHAQNVVDTREIFARKVQANGSARGLLERVLAGDENARKIAEEFVKAQHGEKEFAQDV